jgi:hypothetical protein
MSIETLFAKHAFSALRARPGRVLGLSRRSKGVLIVGLFAGVMVLGVGCASTRKPVQSPTSLSRPVTGRNPDSAPERAAAVNESAGVGDPEVVEQRFAAQEAKERRERTKSTAPGKGQGRVEVDNQKAPAPPP